MDTANPDRPSPASVAHLFRRPVVQPAEPLASPVPAAPVRPQRQHRATTMTNEQMTGILRAVRPGDKLRIVFADKPAEKVRIQMVLVLCKPHPSATLDIGEFPAATLFAIADSGFWASHRAYVATVLDGFDPEDFIYRTLRHGLLESIQKL